MIILMSVQHTGTRFTASFLESLGVIYLQYHTDPKSVTRLAWETKNKAVIPVRDPLLAYLSTHMRSPKRPSNLNEVIIRYDVMLEMEKRFEHVYLNLNTDDRSKELRKVADFCGYPKDAGINFTWSPVGNNAAEPIDLKMWEVLSDKLESGIKDMILNELGPYREHYGY